MCVDVEDDEAVAKYFYHAIKEDAEKPLKAEIERLKARLYDLQNDERTHGARKENL
jgi:uncharacterized small protein (DUF1192 family)